MDKLVIINVPSDSVLVISTVVYRMFSVWIVVVKICSHCQRVISVKASGKISLGKNCKDFSLKKKNIGQHHKQNFDSNRCFRSTQKIKFI